MKRFLFFLTTAGMCLFTISAARAQSLNHVELGVFGEYVRLGEAGNAGFGGLGARLGGNITTHVQLEAALSYDFTRTFTSASGSGTSGSVGFSTSQSKLRILTGMFGPKIQTTGPVRVFALLKGGFVNFGVGGPATAGTINNQIGHIVDGNTDGVFYPGGGVEFNAGWLGFRAEAGDQMFFVNGGTQNNLRVTVGPQFNF